jgi:hypothetical protein
LPHGLAPGGIHLAADLVGGVAQLSARRRVELGEHGSHGFVQNVRLHRRSLLRLGYLRSIVAVAFWDALASFAYLVLIPALAISVDRAPPPASASF